MHIIAWPYQIGWVYLHICDKTKCVLKLEVFQPYSACAPYLNGGVSGPTGVLRGGGFCKAFLTPPMNPPKAQATCLRLCVSRHVPEI